jgi:LmbE family N-acetylglucosaminyl deacetylase
MGIHNFGSRQRRTYLAVLLSLLLTFSSLSQTNPIRAAGTAWTPDNGDKAELYQALLDLTNPWTVMCVAAHPDDEDGSTLTVLRRKYGVHTVSLFSTYGEGGQNAVGPELYEELGVIRARETMAAAEVQGSEPHFLGMKDFGFSKSAEETFRAWGEKEPLRRMVLQIRTLRPDVIITNHDTTSGHGHHQATGRLVLQAFDAAADPKQFPEQLSQVSTWQVQRLFVRGFRNPNSPPANQAAPPETVTIDPNEMDPIRGNTYAQQALAGLQKHATQGPWPKTISATGGRIARYSLARQSPSAAALPADAKTPLDGLTLPETIAPRLAAPTIDNKPLTEHLNNRGEILVSLINARRKGAFTAPKAVVDLDPNRFMLMISRLDRALAVTSEVSLSVKSTDQVLVPGMTTTFDVALTNQGDSEVAVKQLTLNGPHLPNKLEAAEKLLPGTDTALEAKITTAKVQPISVPSADHLYDGNLFGEHVTADAQVEIEGTRFWVTGATEVDVAPAVEIINNNPTPCVETPATALSCSSASLTLVNHLRTPYRGKLELSATKNPELPAITQDVSLAARESQKVITGKLSERELPGFRVEGAKINIALKEASAKETTSQLTIPAIYIPSIAIAGLRVGYVRSTDDTLKHSLAALGVEAKELSVDSVAKNDLSGFNTIIIDNRGYEAHPELIGVNNQLLKFAEDGGTLIVFYHKTEEWNPNEGRNRPQLAPYPIILGGARVTEEDAPIRILQPQHPLLNTPNKITQADFANWIQERGLYFPSEWDQHYTALLSTNDQGEKPLNGGLLVAGYGKGNYIYTSLVWYRQLRAGIPGGYRFFANMISYGHRN